MTAMYTHLRAACSFEKLPLALTALRTRALMLSRAFVSVMTYLALTSVAWR